MKNQGTWLMAVGQHPETDRESGEWLKEQQCLHAVGYRGTTLHQSEAAAEAAAEKVLDALAAQYWGLGWWAIWWSPRPEGGGECRSSIREPSAGAG